MYETLDELSFKEILGYSIRAEEKAKEFYTQISEGVSELMEHRFQSLAADEAIHKQELLRLHEKLFGDKDYVVPEKEGLPPHEGDAQVDTVGSLLETLNTAMENEKNAFKIYDYLAENQEKYAALFKYLAVMEHGHFESLKKEKELLEGRTAQAPEMKERSPDGFLEFLYDRRQIQ
ncbi:MAG: ferritin family protein [Thermoplasmatota archaeon]